MFLKRTIGETNGTLIGYLTLGELLSSRVPLIAESTSCGTGVKLVERKLLRKQLKENLHEICSCLEVSGNVRVSRVL